MVEHAPGYPAVAGLEEAGGDHVQTLRVVGHLAEVWKISRQFGMSALSSSSPHVLDKILRRGSECYYHVKLSAESSTIIIVKCRWLTPVEKSH
jgi:hypothetical protein